MKKFRALLILLLMCAVCSAVEWPISSRNVSSPSRLRRLLQSRFDNVEADVAAISSQNQKGIGDYYYVDSARGNAASIDGLSWIKAEPTVDDAMSNCTDNNGDVIWVAQSHTYTKSVTGALFTADVNGVTIMCLGEGDDRSAFILAHTGAKIDITANNVRFSGFYLDACAVDSVDTPFNISGEGCIVDNFWIRLSDSVGQADLCFTLGIADGDANDLTIANGRITAPDAGAASAITFAKDFSNVILSNLRIYGDFSTTPIEVPSGGNAQVNLSILDCVIVSKNADEPAIEINGTGNTGVIDGCSLISDAEATVVDAGGLTLTQNNSLNLLGNSEGAILPVNMTLVDLMGNFTGPDDGADYDDNILSHLKKLSTYIADGDGDYVAGQALPSNKSLYDIIGETYIDDGAGDHLDDVYAHLNLIMKYLADGSGGGAVVGANPPTGKSLFDIMGDEYTDDGGNDHLDSIAAHINLLSKYIADGDGDWATGSTMPSDKSIYDIFGAYTADGGADDEDTIQAHLDLLRDQYSVSKSITSIDNGTDGLFTVAGGPIQLISIYTMIDTVIGSEGCTFGYNVNPTTGTDTVFGSDGTPLELNAAPAGAILLWSHVLAADLTKVDNGAALVTGSVEFVIPVGAIEALLVNDGTVTGAYTVYITYRPMAPGVTVVAQ